MPAIHLTPAERKEKRGDAHHLDPVVLIGDLVLWRPILDKPKAEVRDDRGAGPRVVKILKFSKSGSQRAQIKKITVFGNQRVTPGGEIKRVQKRVTSVKKKAAD